MIKQWDLALLRPNKKISVFILLFYGQIKKISVFRVTGLKILGRVGKRFFFFYFFFFWKKIYNFMHFERHLAFQNA